MPANKPEAEPPPSLPSAAISVADGDRLPSYRRRCRLSLLVFFSFLVFSAVRSPVPGVNEPHYLSKARHFWQPEWCAGDFFLESSEAHLVFYATIGGLTNWLTFEQTAWIGRILTCILLAVGWTELMVCLVPGRWSALWTAWLFLAISAVGNFSGEWIVGGLEAKGFAYACVLLALASVCRRHWLAGTVFSGLAISLHPVIGLWNLGIAGFASAMCGGHHTHEHISRKRFRPSTATIAGLLLLLILLSLPGLLPVVRLIGSASSTVAFQADFIQVYYRLGHHLNPRQFSPWAFAGYFCLLTVWLTGRRKAEFPSCERWFSKFILGTVLVAAAGLLIGLIPMPTGDTPLSAFRVKLMRFYPFRLFDVMLPIAASITVVGWIQHWLSKADTFRTEKSLKPIDYAAWTLFIACMVWSLLIPTVDRNPSRMTPQQLEDWKDVCGWIARETPEDALFLTPRQSWAFKWYAERSEYVAFKDCPQDAVGIVEWNRRLKYLRKWARDNYHSGYSSDAVRRLHDETGISHLVVHRLGPFESPLLYKNGSYRVFEAVSDNASGTEVSTRSSKLKP